MHFYPTRLPGAWRIQLEPASDSRGYFARTFCLEEFAAQGLETSFPQHSISFSAHKGTLRGMHYQRGADSEVKVVRCLKGSIWDVIIDIRPDSPTYRQWLNIELSSENGDQLYIPSGFAHGFQTLCNDVVVNYLISMRYSPQSACGARYNDKAFAIDWPLPISQISAKDAQWPDFCRSIA